MRWRTKKDKYEVCTQNLRANLAVVVKRSKKKGIEIWGEEKGNMETGERKYGERREEI